MNKTIVELTEDEAKSFLKWRQNQENWDILERAGVFSITNGSAEVHFNNVGQIGLINTHLASFRRVKVSLSTKPREIQFDKQPKSPMI